jgi:putative phage-type endonuclease
MSRRMSDVAVQGIASLSPGLASMLKATDREEGCVFGTRHWEAVLGGAMGEFYREKVVLSAEERLQLCQDTLRQDKDQAWHQERRNRISASRAHRIARARMTETALKYFFEHTCDNFNLAYGRDTEPIAKACLQNLLDVEILPVGLVTKANQPWLCASPDGLLSFGDGKLAVLEVKCPSSCIDKDICVPYLLRGDVLKKSHPYFAQIQVQLYCCGLSTAYLFVYTSADQRLVEVKMDLDYLRWLIPRLETIYFENILPVLCQD